MIEHYIRNGAPTMNYCFICPSLNTNYIPSYAKHPIHPLYVLCTHETNELK